MLNRLLTRLALIAKISHFFADFLKNFESMYSYMVEKFCGKYAKNGYFSNRMEFLKKSNKFILLFFLLVSACDQQHKTCKKEVEIPGRFSSLLYRIKVPEDWEVDLNNDPLALQDTMNPLCTIKVGEENQIKINIHNFMNEISPEAQVARWQKQIMTENFELTPCAGAGFGGLKLEMYTEENGVIGYAIQLLPKLKEAVAQEMAAPVTIKATGDSTLLYNHREQIEALYQSFELIEPIFLSL